MGREDGEARAGFNSWRFRDSSREPPRLARLFQLPVIRDSDDSKYFRLVLREAYDPDRPFHALFLTDKRRMAE
jgi:hypothetical protein